MEAIPLPATRSIYRRRRSPASYLMTGLMKLLTLGLPTGLHMTRYRMYHDLEEALRPYRVVPGVPAPVILAIGRSLPLAQRLGIVHAQIIDSDHHQHDALDLSNVPDNSLDFLVSDQVLEHVYGNPQRVFDEALRVLKPGGIAIHTTCLLEELHGGIDATGHLRDYWRFTPNGLTYLCRDFSKVITVGWWGNRLSWLGLRYLPIPHAPWHPLHQIAMTNSPHAAQSVWIVSQK